MSKLNKSISVDDFEHGYWYAVEIKAFAKEIGIKSTSSLRKDELEELIIHFLKTGQLKQASRDTKKSDQIDSFNGLKLNQHVINYTNNKVTKDFLETESAKFNPDFKRKSGSRYRLNRWREEQISKGIQITYADLIAEYVRLNEQEGSFPQVEIGRYINFVANYLANEKNSNREEAIQTWKKLKKLPIPKTYEAWKNRK